MNEINSFKKRAELMTRREDELNQNETPKPKSKLGVVLVVVATVIVVLGLFFYWYISGLARGFSNS